MSTQHTIGPTNDGSIKIICYCCFSQNSVAPIAMNRSDIGCVTFAENIVFHLANSVCRRLAECHHYAKCVVYACVCEMRKKINWKYIRPKNRSHTLTHWNRVCGWIRCWCRWRMQLNSEIGCRMRMRIMMSSISTTAISIQTFYPATDHKSNSDLRDATVNFLTRIKNAIQMCSMRVRLQSASEIGFRSESSSLTW